MYIIQVHIKNKNMKTTKLIARKDGDSKQNIIVAIIKIWDSELDAVEVLAEIPGIDRVTANAVVNHGPVGSHHADIIAEKFRRKPAKLFTRQTTKTRFKKDLLLV
jgi:hypothetical protein